MSLITPILTGRVCACAAALNSSGGRQRPAACESHATSLCAGFFALRAGHIKLRDIRAAFPYWPLVRGSKIVDDAAVLHDVVAVGDSGGEMEILLDQKNGEALRLSVPMVWRICWMMTGAKPSVGSSSSNSRAPVRRMRAIASICCSPPESLVPWLSAARADWETARRCARDRDRRAAPAAAAADFPHIETGENAALLRTKGDAGRAMRPTACRSVRVPRSAPSRCAARRCP